MSLLLTFALVTFTSVPIVEPVPAGAKDIVMSLDGTVRSLDRSAPRDPFRPVTAAEPAGCPIRGLAGFLIKEVKVTGLIRTSGGPLAIVTAPDGRAYLAREGDSLYDGVIARITMDRVVFKPNRGNEITASRAQ